MKPAADLASIEDLDRNILTLCSHINAATYELLVLIREFDERAGWLKCGLGNCAEWLAWRCDFSMTTALEKVRVAHALKTLPGISGAFASGELSYSKVRALTRVEVTKTSCWCLPCEQRQSTLLSDAVNCAVAERIRFTVPHVLMPGDLCVFVVTRIDTR